MYRSLLVATLSRVDWLAEACGRPAPSRPGFECWQLLLNIMSVGRSFPLIDFFCCLFSSTGVKIARITIHPSCSIFCDQFLCTNLVDFMDVVMIKILCT
jgi:hypothetical protein